MTHLGCLLLVLCVGVCISAKLNLKENHTLRKNVHDNKTPRGVRVDSKQSHLPVVDVKKLYNYPLDGEPSYQEEFKPLLLYAMDKLRTVPGAEQAILDTLVPLIGPGHEAQVEQFKFLLHKFMQSRDDDPTLICLLCSVIFDLLKLLTDMITWEQLRDPIVFLCEILLSLGGTIPTRVDIICPGTIDLQGPHIFYIISELNFGLPDFIPVLGGRADMPNARSMCENLNLCFRSESNSGKTGRRRTGPAVKALGRGSKQHASHGGRDKPAMAATGRGEKVRLAERAKAMAHGFGRPHTGERQPREARNTVRVAHLTDVHMDKYYSHGAATECHTIVCCRDFYDGDGEARMWGEYDCNTPATTVDLFLRKVNEIEPDFIIYSGDTPPHSLWNETYESQLEYTESLAQAMQNKLSGRAIYPNIGNHEMFPTNLFYVPLNATQDMTNAFTDIWGDIAGFDEAAEETMRTAGYYTVLAQTGLRIISFNTNYWYSANFYNTLNDIREDDVDMYQWMEDELEKAKDNEEKVILIGHHPPGSSNSIVFHTQPVMAMLAEHADTIILYIGGHTHKDEFRMVRDPDTNEARQVVLVAPSVTPRGTMNPSVRLYELDADTFELMEYHQYYMDIVEAANEATDPELELAYTASEEYSLGDMSAAAFDDLVHRFDEDDELFQTYYYHYHGQTREGSTCTGTCKDQHLCRLSNSNYDVYLDCVDERASAGITDPPGSSTDAPTDPACRPTVPIWMAIFSAAVFILL